MSQESIYPVIDKAPFPFALTGGENAVRNGPKSRRIALVVEYNGSKYVGFQLQANQPTIQGEIERSLARFTGETIRIRFASRTDSGAHAQGQVVDFLTCSEHPVDTFARASNHYLPNDIEVIAAFEVSPEFNSRRDAINRTYRYNIINRSWPSPLRQHTHFWVREALNVTVMARAAKAFVGTHDFRPFAGGYPQDTNMKRTVRKWDVWAEDDTIVIECEANGFLRHQIRRADGLLVEIGKGRYPEEAVTRALNGTIDGDINRFSVPAHGLCLMKVTYQQPLADMGSKIEAY
jgi:tRNA pseudouridine38-40 synthase